MPNWCSNSITVSHTDPAMITKFADACREGKLFETFAPLPTKDGEWEYGTAIETWGTKWDINNEDIIINYQKEDVINLHFDTAWSPPITFYEKFIEKYGGEIHATFCEPGNDFIGMYGPEGVKDWSLTDPNVPESLKEDYEGIYLDMQEMEEENN